MRPLGIPPPRLRLRPATQWVLLRAFGPIGAPSAAPAGKAALQQARQLGLAARIAARSAAGQLERELGSAGARTLAYQHLQTRATNQALAATMARVAEVARRLDTPLIWLKHAALWSTGVVQAGQRDARDVDVLVDEARAHTLHAALCDHGFTRVGDRAPDYHLTPLRDVSGACVEVHHRIWGFRVATAELWRRQQLAQPLPESPSIDIPRRDVLAAHAIVHGFVQHLSSPGAYAPVRVLADLVDLQAWELDPATVASHLEPETSGEVEASLAVAASLARGVVFQHFAPRSPESELLAHVIHASLRPSYAARLKLLRVLELQRDRELLPALHRLLQRVLPTR